ncbi:MAG: sigma-54 dependent transcriptional regulator [Acidobacteriota bacterium]
MSVLIVEDKDSLRRMLRKTLEAEGHEIEEASDGAQAIEMLEARRFSLVLTDLRLPKADGLAVLQAALAADPEQPVIVMTAYGTVELAVEAMKVGACDFLAKPVDPDHLVLLVSRVARQDRLQRENEVLREALGDRVGGPTIIGESELLKTALQEVSKVAATDATVLLLGESGTGKELFARSVHHHSPRHDQPFVAINCAAIPDTLLENELFGHEKGAYTGASSRKAGRFELAEGGTLFLDEIGDIAASVQAKLLRVLQEKSFERVGGTRTLEVDVRIVTATNRDLAKEVAAGRFREDLYYRLSVFPLEIPSLARRREDIPLLASHFLSKFSRQLGRPGLKLSDGALECLEAHHWPGNVRELENAIERAAILADSPTLEADDFMLAERSGPNRDRIRDLVDFDGPLQEVASRAASLVEELKIQDALQEREGNKTKAAELLGVSYKTLLNKMRDLGLK